MSFRRFFAYYCLATALVLTALYPLKYTQGFQLSRDLFVLATQKRAEQERLQQNKDVAQAIADLKKATDEANKAKEAAKAEIGKDPQ